MEEHTEHDRYEADLAAYLLDALEPAETERLQRHLDRCERCRSRARWLQGAVDVLPETVAQIEPPVSLRTRLMAEIGTDASALEPRRSKKRSGGFSLSGLVLRPAAGFAVIAVMIAGVFGYVIGNDEDGDYKGVAVDATERAPEATASLLRTDSDSGVLRVGRLPVQPRGKVYELWLRRGAEVKPSTLFVVRRDGTGAAAITTGLDDADEVMVTLEPERGSSMPTTEPVLRARI